MSRDLALGFLLGVVLATGVLYDSPKDAPPVESFEAKEAALDRAFGAGRTEAMLIQCQADLKVAKGGQ